MSQKRNKLPKNAKRVFKGVIFEVWQWKQKMFDGSTAIYEKLERSDSVEIIPVVGDKILIQIQRQPDRPKFLSLPGGVCDKGEKPPATAKRELLEETGFFSRDWTLLKKYEPYSKIVWNVYTYLAKNCEYKKEQRLDAGEKIKLKLLTFEEFLMLSDEPTFRHKSLKDMLIRARFNKKSRKEFKKLLFGK
ncbi:MAG: NUDIX hydrolase [Patescibacteria group bacterium]|nr:NUDIX hydrolase [Patescibacteria group bacterium]